MNKVPELVPISELRTHQAAILEQLKKGPIVLTHHSKAAAVLVGLVYTCLKLYREFLAGALAALFRKIIKWLRLLIDN